MDEHNTLDIPLFSVKRTKNIYRNFIFTEKSHNLTGFNAGRNHQNKFKQQVKEEQTNNEASKRSDLEIITSTKLTVNKRYQNISKTIQSSVSNQESSVQSHTERRFLKRRERVYHNLKKTESCNSCLSNFKAKNENLFVEENLITGLFNMDRRKENETRNPRLKLNDNIECCGCECTNCKQDKQLIKNGRRKEKQNDLDYRKSRVTIFGQLGLTQDDQYVLNCAATLNDRPIQTNYTDRNIGFRHHETNNDKETKATQATQVNFNFSKQKSIKDYKNKTVQCCCNNTDCKSMMANVSDTEPEDVELKHCKSPLVVISVYPREDSEENIKNNSVKIIRRQISPQNKIFSSTHQVNNIQVKNERKQKKETAIHNGFVERKLNKSRSPSPAVEAGYYSKAQNKSPDSNIRMINKPKHVTPLRHTSPDKSGTKFKDVKQNILFNSSKYTKETDVRKEQRDARRSNKEQVKKALVNTFLKNNKLLDPKGDTSKITIDINGDKEQYNVLFEKRNFDTGLTVRKTVKAQSSKKYNQNQSDGGKLMKNLLLLDNVEDKDKEFCKSRLYAPQCHKPKLTRTSESRLEVRDSLEICHRREERNSSRIELNQRQTNFNKTPIKHYRGDNCSVTDPGERDKEIRKLLGILRKKQNEDPDEPEIICPKNENGDCCIHNERLKESTIKSNVPKFLSSNLTLKNIKKIRGPSKNTNYFDFHRVKENIFNVQTKTEGQIYSSHKNNNNEARLNTLKDFVTNDVPSNIQNSFFLFLENEKLILKRDTDLPKEQVNNSQRALILTKQQYDKVRKIIKRTVSNKLSSEKRKRYSMKQCNVVSIGNVKIKPKLKRPLQCDCKVQTETIYKCIGSQYDPQNIIHCKESDRKINNDILNKHTREQNYLRRHAVSSMEIRYASFGTVGYIKPVSISSMQVEKEMVKSLQNEDEDKDNKSLHTIFKGKRKCVTPNLGTSAFSLNSDSMNGSNYSIRSPPYAGDCKMKKPFLQRLLSCLVMRSPQTSGLKNIEKPRKLPIQNCSLDSYYLGTSLGAFEMSSSIYDTSASFYSNHSIIPINKTKRGFFNSVRGFLTIKRN